MGGLGRLSEVRAFSDLSGKCRPVMIGFFVSSFRFLIWLETICSVLEMISFAS